MACPLADSATLRPSLCGCAGSLDSGGPSAAAGKPSAPGRHAKEASSHAPHSVTTSPLRSTQRSAQKA
eukprot:7391853-Prymnesium_polylepis.2